MKMYSPDGLEQILKICKAHSVITIADEVMTGFGKTGTHFASLQLETYPDIMCLSKALTAGVAAMSITTCTQEIYNAFLDDSIEKAFLHAHTYSANPLACAAAIAGIDLLISEEIQNDISRISEKHNEFLEQINHHEKVANVRQLGVILAIDLNVEMERYGDLRNKLFAHFMKAGVFLRPLGNTIYILPPYVITNEQLYKIYTAIEKVL
jgi:adenosylmethionine-8-amino-7-oxononanoate aminotransferase